MEICQDGIKIILFYSQCLLERKILVYTSICVYEVLKFFTFQYIYEKA